MRIVEAQPIVGFKRFEEPPLPCCEAGFVCFDFGPSLVRRKTLIVEFLNRAIEVLARSALCILLCDSGVLGEVEAVPIALSAFTFADLPDVEPLEFMRRAVERFYPPTLVDRALGLIHPGE